MSNRGSGCSDSVDIWFIPSFRLYDCGAVGWVLSCDSRGEGSRGSPVRIVGEVGGNALTVGEIRLRDLLVASVCISITGLFSTSVS